MKKFFKIFLWILAGLLFVGTFVYLFLNSREPETEYDTVNPQISDIERTTVLTGTIEPRDEIEIKPQISGIISEILVEPGDHVKDGDIIARIKVIPEESQLSSALNRVQTAKVSLETARLSYERTKTLYEKKYESREKLENDKAAYENARLELLQAQDQLTIVRDGVSRSNAQGSNTLVRSTVTGIVLEVPVKVGSSVIQANTFNDGTTIAKVADMNDLVFKGKIDETEVDLVKEGMDVRISVAAVSGSDFPATIEKIAPMATDNNGTNTFEVKAAIGSGEAGRLRAGYSANATVVLEKAERVLTVPESIIEYEGEKAYVYMETDSAGERIFRKTLIRTGISDGIKVEAIHKGMNEKSRLRGNAKTDKK